MSDEQIYRLMDEKLARTRPRETSPHSAERKIAPQNGEQDGPDHGGPPLAQDRDRRNHRD